MIFKKYKSSFVIFCLISLVFTSPLFFHLNRIGIVNWDQLLFYEEAQRKSVLEYHQLPFWNPYHCGGNVLLSHPETSFFSPRFLFTLLFGTLTGAKLAIVAHFFFGLVAMYFLARHFKLTPLASYASAFAYMLSAQFMVRMGTGNFLFLAMAFFPMALFFFLKSLKKRKYERYVVFSALFIALVFFSGEVYELSFFLLFISIYASIRCFTEQRLKPLILIIFILLFSFLFASIKLIPSLDFINDTPRKAMYSSDELTSFKEFANDIIKSVRLSKYYGKTPMTQDDPPWWEGNMGFGIIGTLLIFTGGFFCFKKEKALFFTTSLFVLIFLGSTLPISLWRLLHFVPPFNSLYVIGRLSIILTFAFAILIGFGFSGLESYFGKRKVNYYLFLLLLITLLCSLFFMNNPILSDALRIQIPTALEKSPAFFQTISNHSYNDISYSTHYLTILENKGDLTCLDEVRPATSVSAVPKESDLYKGEAYLKDGGETKVIYFSPNKLIIETNSLKDNLLVLNQNYEKNWYVKPGEVENYQGLLATKISKGKNVLTFYYFPRSFIIGAVFSFFSLFLSYFFIKGYNQKVLFLFMVLLVVLALIFFYNSKEIVKVPEVYSQLSSDQEQYNVIEIPFTSPLFHAFRYYAEQHDKEVIWHHPSQRISYKVHLLKKIFLADDPLDDKVTSDIIIQDPQRIALSVLNYYNIKKVILHKTWYGDNLDWKVFSNEFVIYNFSNYKDWYGNEHYNKTKEFLDKTLKKSYEDEELIVYDVPLEKNKQPFLLMDEGGYGLEFDEKGERFSWVKNKFSITINSFREMNISIKLKVYNFYEAKTLEAYKDNMFIDKYRIEHPREIIVNLKLNEGENKIEFKVKEKCQRPSEVLNSHDWRCLNVAIRVLGMVS